VSPDDLEVAVADLRKIAVTDGLSDLVVVQPRLSGSGEVFLGLTGSTELGPVLAFGLGGVFIEVMKRVSGRVAPFSLVDAEELIAEFDDLGIVDGFRGGRPWNRAQLAQILLNAGDLLAGARQWIQSMDINPLIVTDEGFVAVDCVCFVN
jgi:hypothetical protein